MENPQLQHRIQYEILSYTLYHRHKFSEIPWLLNLGYNENTGIIRLKDAQKGLAELVENDFLEIYRRHCVIDEKVRLSKQEALAVIKDEGAWINQNSKGIYYTFYMNRNLSGLKELFRLEDILFEGETEVSFLRRYEKFRDSQTAIKKSA